MKNSRNLYNNNDNLLQGKVLGGIKKKFINLLLGKVSNQKNVKRVEKNSKREVPNKNSTNNEEEPILKQYEERKKKVFKHFTNDQLKRYRYFKNTKIPGMKVRSKLKELYGINIGKKGNTALCGITKVYIGEIVELAKEVMNEWNYDPTKPIQPAHLIEAHRRYENNNIIKQPKKRFLCKRI